MKETISNSFPPLVFRVLSLCKRWLAHIDWKFVLLLSLPLFLIGLNDSWLFSYVLRGYIDPWIYFGYFLDLKQHLNTFAGTYYGSRLPWILPGFLAYKLFSPLTAAYVLHLIFYYAANISLYQILKQVIGRYTALLTSILMGCHYFFLQAIGCDYVDGAGVAFLLLTLLMLTPKEQSNHLRLCLAGVFYGCLIYTQLFLIVYTPLILLYYLFVNWKNTQSKVFDLLGYHSFLRYFGMGFIGLTFVFCMINYCLNREFFFFFPSIKFTGWLILKNEVNPWWSPISNWWIRATWILLPAITFLGSILVSIFYRNILKNRNFVLFFQIFFIVNLLMSLLLELVGRQPVLSYHYYASYMMPAMFLALGSQLAMIVNQLKRQKFYLFLGIVCIISLAAYLFPIDFQWLEQVHVHLLASIIFFGIAGLVFTFIQYRYLKEIGLFLVVISTALINISATRDWQYDSSRQKNAFLAVVETVRMTKSMDPLGHSRFWYNFDPQLGSLFRAVSSTYLWGYRVFNEKFPELGGLAESLTHPFLLNDRVFILSADDAAVEKANQSLAKIGFRGEPIDEKSLNLGTIQYKINYLKICKLEDVKGFVE